MTKRNDLTIYDTEAEGWWDDDTTRWVRTLKAMVPGRLSHFDTLIDWSGKTVLDLGCAGGFMAEALDDRGAQVTGIDPAEQAIEAARRHAGSVGKNIRYDVGVGEDLPYDSGSFDAVVCVDVLEHVSDLPQVIREVARVLTPGGAFLFDTINDTRLARFGVITMAEDVLRLLPKGTHDPDLFINPKDLTHLLEETGFDVGELTGLGPRGMTRRGIPTFGRVPTTQIIYMGSARLIRSSGPPQAGTA